MFRLLLDVILPAALPFVAYAIWLRVRRVPAAGKGILIAAATALLLVAVTLGGLAHFGGSPPDSVYVPAHLDETGTLVPGAFAPRPAP